MLHEFFEIGKMLSSEKDPIKLFETIISSSIRMTSADAGTMYLVVDKKTDNWSTIKDEQYDDKLLKFVISKNISIDTNLEASTTTITPQSIFGYTILTGNSLRIDDAYSMDPSLGVQLNRSFDIQTGYVTKSVLSIPMKDHEDHIMGVLQLINKKSSWEQKINYSDPESLKNILLFNENDELIMNSLAGQAAVALENNLLYRDMKQLLQSYKEQNAQLAFLSRNILKAHEEERKRIAREIHDGPAQSAANLLLKLEIVKKRLQKGLIDNIEDELGKFTGNIRDVVKDIRGIIYDLKPSFLEDGLIGALQSYTTNFEDSTGIIIEFSATGNDKVIEYYLTSTLYRIVQESLSNAQKHAEANYIKINLKITNSKISLSISDNGKGFDASKLKQQRKTRKESGFGLEGMQERIDIVKGKLSIKSAPGEGTRIKIIIPL